MHGRARHLTLTSVILALCFVSACSQKPTKKALPPAEVTVVLPVPERGYQIFGIHREYSSSGNSGHQGKGAWFFG